jgi:hypothetical protein
VGGDPDSDTKWLVVQSNICGTVERALSAYRSLKTDWLEEVAGEQSLLIRFLYNIG